MILFVYTLYSRMVGLIFWDADNWLQCAIFNAIKMMRVENVLCYAWKDKNIGIL